MKFLFAQRRLIWAILVPLLLGACSDPQVYVTFHRTPGDHSVTADELAGLLDDAGLRVIQKRLLNETIILRIRTDLDREAFDDAVAQAMQPLVGEPLSSRVTLTVTETSSNILELLSLETGKNYSGVVDWYSAKASVIDYSQNSETDMVCAVVAQTDETIPSITYSLGAPDIDYDRYTGGTGLGSTLKSMFTHGRVNAENIVELEGLTGKSPPWISVLFFPRETDDHRSTSHTDVVFVFEECRVPAVPYGGMMCEFEYDQCVALIRKRTGGDFFGVTKEPVIKGNVKNFSTGW